MRVVVQRVREASVGVGAREVARIGRGLLVLVAFESSDSEGALDWVARKVSSLRIFEDEVGRMNLSLEEVKGEILVVSQFTLYGNCTKGKRPSFERSAPPEKAEEFYDRFLEKLREEAPCAVKSGVFREHMYVSLVNDGPVTLVIERGGG